MRVQSQQQNWLNGMNLFKANNIKNVKTSLDKPAKNSFDNTDLEKFFDRVTRGILVRNIRFSGNNISGMFL